MKTEELSFDVVIIGGGPAGSSTALSLKKENPNLKIAILEKSFFEKKRSGEMLKVNAKQMLEELNVWQDFLNEEYSPITSSCLIWGKNEIFKNDFITQPINGSWQLNRHDFDTFLLKQADHKGTKTFFGYEFLKIQKNSEKRWCLNIQNQKEEKLTLKASFVVDASGKSSSFALKQGAKKIRFDSLVGVFALFQNKNKLSLNTYSLMETSPDGWWYSVSLPNNKMVIAFMTENDIAKNLALTKWENWWNLLKKSNYTQERLEYSIPSKKILMRTASSFYLDQIHGKGWASVGDAAGSIDPLTGHGITWALQSGINISPFIVNWLKGEDNALENYQKQMNLEYEKYLLERMFVYSLEKRWSENLFWQRHQNHNIKKFPHNKILTKTKLDSDQIKKFHYFNVFSNQ
jgi:flavin-dependent dehydrogenase